MTDHELDPQIQIEDLKKEVKKLRDKLGNFALALALLNEARQEMTSKNKVWVETRWKPGLDLLRIGKMTID